MKMQSNQKRVKEIIKILSKEIPDSRIALKFSNPLELLIATILSAQCTDVKVNQVTVDLFKKYRSAKEYAEVNLTELEEDIRPTGFYRNKAKSVQKCCQELVARLGGKVPQTLEELVTLPGVGRKTANVILGNAFGVPGIAVDTHVHRVSQRIGLTMNDDPVKIEFDLMEIVPREEWTHFSNLLISHGRRTCIARKPLCEICPIRKRCDYGSKVSTKFQISPNSHSPKSKKRFGHLKLKL
ncbi:MAG: endonuclease III [Deltaproteobacteria bacterium RBG_16_47_11]|nr:MAG: endonuclease III [Deltaproteobacteria bacterium RBG_16_47_11]